MCKKANKSSQGKTEHACCLLVQISNPDCSTDAVRVQDVDVEVDGREVVDAKWISNAFHADEPVISSSSRVCAYPKAPDHNV
jgi:hypothetical protein